MSKKLFLILPFLLFANFLPAREYADSALYQGMSVKIDLAMPIIEAARSGGKLQSYNINLNWRLHRRWYPTLELGYGCGERTSDGGFYRGQGGFSRIGADMSVLKKGVNVDCLLVGLRVGGAYQQYDLLGVTMNESYWSINKQDFLHEQQLDAWGEIVVGTQVLVYKGLQLGWFLRLKILFTRTERDGGAMPYYVPGYGFRDDSNWGFNYYIGYNF